MCAKQIKKPGDVPTTGHEWDGIQELDNPMPRWWLWTFYLTIIWSIGYCIFYPAWPLVSSATQGLWGKEAAGDTRLAVAEGHAGDGVRRGVGGGGLQLRQHVGQAVGRVLAVEQQPVEAGAGADLGGVGVGQAEPQTDLRPALGHGLLESVDGGLHAVVS